MNSILTKIAAVLTVIIGAMAVFAGGQVLLGQLPDYYLIDWLPVYNFTVGVISVFFSAVVIWKNSSVAMPTAITTFSIHAVVMLVLQTVYSDVVAPDSIKAMTIRLIAWLIILILMFAQTRKANNPT